MLVSINNCKEHHIIEVCFFLIFLLIVVLSGRYTFHYILAPVKTKEAHVRHQHAWADYI